MERIPICQKAWLRLYGFSNNKISRLQLLYFSGSTRPDHGNRNSSRLSDKTAEAVSFMQLFFEENCDKMPNPAGNRDAWHLPFTTTKAEVHTKYQGFFKSRDYDEADLLSLQHFCRLWREQFPHVTIPERNRFKQCTE